MNKITVNIYIEISLKTLAFISLRYIPKSRNGQCVKVAIKGNSVPTWLGRGAQIFGPTLF